MWASSLKSFLHGQEDHIIYVMLSQSGIYVNMHMFGVKNKQKQGSMSRKVHSMICIGYIQVS